MSTDLPRCSLCGEDLRECANCGFPLWRAEGHADFCTAPAMFVALGTWDRHVRARHRVAA